MDDVDPRDEILTSTSRDLEAIIPKIDAVDWVKRKPTAEHLVLLAEYYRLLLTESWLKEIEYRFQLERITKITGLDEHDINLFVELGGWISMDRRLETMPQPEVERFWDFLNAMDEEIDTEAIVEKAKQAQVARAREITELNSLLEDE